MGGEQQNSLWRGIWGTVIALTVAALIAILFLEPLGRASDLLWSRLPVFEESDPLSDVLDLFKPADLECPYTVGDVSRGDLSINPTEVERGANATAIFASSDTFREFQWAARGEIANSTETTTTEYKAPLQGTEDVISVMALAPGRGFLCVQLVVRLY